MKTRRRLLIGLGVSILACFTGWLFFRASAQDDRLDAIREVVFREILPEKGVAYLSIGTASNPFDSLLRLLHLSISPRDIDPSDSLMQRLRSDKIILKRASLAESKSSGVVDKQTGQPGTLYYAEIIRRRSATEYEVRGGYYCGGLCAEGCLYHVVLEQGQWRIKGSSDCWIS
jgi:hypothetical protein